MSLLNLKHNNSINGRLIELEQKIEIPIGENKMKYVLTSYSAADVGVIFSKGTGPTIYEAVVNSVLGDLVTDKDEFLDQLLESVDMDDSDEEVLEALKQKLGQEQEVVANWIVLPDEETYDAIVI